MQERHIIFGGASRLREEIRNATQIVEGELYAVVSGCPAEMVGDDIGAMVREAVDSGKNAVYISAPGIRGDAFSGYEAAVSSLLEAAAGDLPRDERLVNVWGIAPYIHRCWLAELYALSDFLEHLHYRMNWLFGPEASLNNWRRAASAGVNLSLTRYGRRAARQAASKYDGAVIETSAFPIGPEGERELASLLGEDPCIADRSRRLFDYRLRQSARFYYEQGAQRCFNVVSDLSRALSKARFLADELGLQPRGLVITDTEEKEAGAELLSFVETHGAALLFSDTESEIRRFLRDQGGEITIDDLSDAYPAFTQNSFGAAGGERLVESVFDQIAQ
jgi:nitrogenase molybdenum-iron protein beta chain